MGGTCVPTATRDMHRHQCYDSKHSRYDVYDLLPQQCKFAPSHRALFIPLPRRMPPPNQRISSGPGIFFQKCVAVPVEECNKGAMGAAPGCIDAERQPTGLDEKSAVTKVGER